VDDRPERKVRDGLSFPMLLDTRPSISSSVRSLSPTGNFILEILGPGPNFKCQSGSINGSLTLIGVFGYSSHLDECSIE